MSIARTLGIERLALAGALAAATVAGGLAVAPSAALAQSTLSAGSTITAKLESSDINSKNAQVGDGFTMRVARPYPNDNPAFANSTIRGHVSNVRAAGQGRKAILTLAFDSITFANGTHEPISGYTESMATKDENTTARKALGAGAGMAVGSQTLGRIIGGGAGGALGTLVGAAGGFAYANNAKPNMNLATGANVVIQTDEPITIPRRQSSQ